MPEDDADPAFGKLLDRVSRIADLFAAGATVPQMAEALSYMLLPCGGPALIDAVATRYVLSKPVDRKKLNAAYARAIPTANYAALAAISSLSDLARQALSFPNARLVKVMGRDNEPETESPTLGHYVRFNFKAALITDEKDLSDAEPEAPLRIPGKSSPGWPRTQY